MVFALHTLSIFFGTEMNVWIFSKMFRKKENWCWKEMLCEVILGILFLIPILQNFAKNMPMAVKGLFFFIWIIGILFYRYGIENHKKGNKYVAVLNGILLCLEFGSSTGLLAWNAWNSYISAPMIFLGNIYMPFLFFRYFQCNWFQGYLWTMLYEATVEIIKGTYMVYIGGIESRTILEVNVSGRLQTVDAVVFGLAIYVVMGVLVCYFNLCPILRKALCEHKGFILLFSLTEYYLLDFFTDLGRDGFNSQDIVQVLVITIIVVLVVLMLMVGMFKRSIEAEKRLLDVRNDAVEQQYVELRHAYDQNRCLVHDEKHRMQYIEECLEHRDIERASVFLREYRERLQADARRAWTGLPTLDFIINMKSRRMEELAIVFRLSAEVDSVPFSDADLVVLLGNLFDNAMEAAQRCPMGQRSIELQMKNANAMFLLIMENTSASAPSQKKGRFLTSKAEKENHGWGIESIRHIVQKYDGEIDFSYDASRFRVWIMVGSGDGESPETVFREKRLPNE